MMCVHVGGVYDVCACACMCVCRMSDGGGSVKERVKALQTELGLSDTAAKYLQKDLEGT